MKTNLLTDRQRCIRDLIAGARNLTYAFLKYFYLSIEEIPEHSDIDLIVEEHQLNRWEDLLRGMKHLKKITFDRKSFARFARLYFEDGGYLEVDLIHRFQHQSLIFLNRAELLTHTRVSAEGVKYLDPRHDFVYISYFFTLNQSAVPGKYRVFFEEYPRKVQENILVYLNKNAGLSERKIDPYFDGSLEAKIRKKLETRPENQGIRRMLRRWNAFRNAFSTPAPMISFSGVDGAGKSTILNLTRQTLSDKYRREIKYLRHRPSILPILSSFKHGKQAAEQKAANTLPRTGNNRSRLSSLFRFTYYYLDYLLGQWFVYVKYSMRGITVLYDRYYFDFIVDGKRSNIILSPGLVRALYRGVLTPELNILLYADPEVILARKQELSREDILSLTDNYCSLFDDLGKRYGQSHFLPINNTDLDSTLQQIENRFTEIA